MLPVARGQREVRAFKHKMKQPDIIEVALKVVRVFEVLNIPYHISGSLASSAFGIARATLDVDMVADIKLQQADSIYESLNSSLPHRRMSFLINSN